ncbi:MAG: YkgJ family cysteine cluster protein [Myxococcales bacterium]|nr:YkgJ family cysteine cluster protein [Myxococcales bacterium]
MKDVETLHAEVDAASRRLTVLHAERLACARGCHDCCRDDLTVFEVEAALIRRHHGALLREGRPHPEGGCAFLDDAGACRIYPHRPYVCRTQGLPLRWIDDEAEAEYRDICPLNEAGPPIEELEPEACWTLGPAEASLAGLQAADGHAGERVALRSLFAHDPDPRP